MRNESHRGVLRSFSEPSATVVNRGDGVSSPLERAALRLRISGAFPVGERYPHTTAMIRALRQCAGLELSGACDPQRQDRSLFEMTRSSTGAVTRWVLAYGFNSAREAIADCLRWRRQQIDVVLLPYPAIGVLFFLSLVPRRMRPPVVADIFISLADTIVGDRKRVSERSVFAHLISSVEARAIRAADIALFDTAGNAQWASAAMGLDAGRVLSTPLFIDRQIFSRSPYRARPDRPTRVLFVGTFVPLHGVERLAQAIGLLRHRDDIEFQIVGDGQSAEAFARALASGPRVRWDRGWKSAAEIAQLIRDADICLGIFGETPKARRVWPLKNYCYMAVGRALVTSAAYGLPQGLPAVEGVEFVAAGADGGRQLADAILRLADDPVLRQRLAREAADYFEAHLDGAEALRRLCTAFCELSAQGRSRRDFAP